MARRLNAQHLQSDLIRRELESQRTQGSTDRYSDQRKDEVYQAMLERTIVSLRADQAVVVDGTFLDGRHLQASRRIASDLQVPYLSLFCDCPREVAKVRVRDRANQPNHLSEADDKLVEVQFDELTVPVFDVINLRVDATDTVEQNADFAVRSLIETVRP